MFFENSATDCDSMVAQYDLNREEVVMSLTTPHVVPHHYNTETLHDDDKWQKHGNTNDCGVSHNVVLKPFNLVEGCNLQCSTNQGGTFDEQRALFEKLPNLTLPGIIQSTRNADFNLVQTLDEFFQFFPSSLLLQRKSLAPSELQQHESQLANRRILWHVIAVPTTVNYDGIPSLKLLECLAHKSDCIHLIWFCSTTDELFSSKGGRNRSTPSPRDKEWAWSRSLSFSGKHDQTTNFSDPKPRIERTKAEQDDEFTSGRFHIEPQVSGLYIISNLRPCHSILNAQQLWYHSLRFASDFQCDRPLSSRLSSSVDLDLQIMPAEIATFYLESTALASTTTSQFPQVDYLGSHRHNKNSNINIKSQIRRSLKFYPKTKSRHSFADPIIGGNQSNNKTNSIPKVGVNPSPTLSIADSERSASASTSVSASELAFLSGSSCSPPSQNYPHLSPIQKKQLEFFQQNHSLDSRVLNETNLYVRFVPFPNATDLLLVQNYIKEITILRQRSMN